MQAEIHTNKTTMTADELREEFEQQAEWRRYVATRYPDDERNEEAAEIFDRLAATVKDCPPEVIEATGELFRDYCEAEEWSVGMRLVGFSRTYGTAEEFCRDFIDAVQGRHR